MIEEFFKALKTGCSLEKREIESYDALARSSRSSFRWRTASSCYEVSTARPDAP